MPFKPFRLPHAKWVLIFGATTLLLASAMAGESNADDEAKSSDRGKASESAELSVPPLTHVIYPNDRPAWVTAAPEQNDNHTSFVVTSGPCASPDEATEMVRVLSRGEVQSHVNDFIRRQDFVVDSTDIPLDDAWIENELVVRRYNGTVEAGEETQFETACLIRIEAKDQARFETAVANVRLKERLAATGVTMLGGFASLIGGSIVLGGLANRQRRVTG